MTKADYRLSHKGLKKTISISQPAPKTSGHVTQPRLSGYAYAA
jgi:hypothetical protein